MCHVVRKAHEMGVHTIVTDYYDNKKAPAKTESDESYDVSALDVEAVVDLARRTRADGVFTGYSDITLMPCRKVCDALGFPFYATSGQLESTLNKRKFKELCRKHNIRVVEDIGQDLIKNDAESIRYPVIVKPADSYSSRGITVCHGPESLHSSIATALAVSTCKEVVVEEFIVADDVYLYMTVQDGVLSLSAMADRLMNNQQHGFAPQPVGYVFPSKHIDIYFERTHSRLQNMVDDLGLRNGTFFVQGFVIRDEITLFEMGLRLSGGAGYLLITHQNGIDPVKMHINYALTGEFSGWDVRSSDKPRFEKPHCVIVVLLKNGTVSDVLGWGAVTSHPAVFETVRLINPGDVLTQAGTLNQVFARIYVSASDASALRQAIDEVRGSLQVKDVDGNEMILDSFDSKVVLE